MSTIDTTIVVLSYNGKSVTEKFIELLYANTSTFNLIMIDNGSTDGTKEYLSESLGKFDNHTLVLNDQNLGVIGGRNMGFALYQNEPTDLLCFLDNDQFVRKEWLEQYREFMDAGNFDVIGADAWLMDATFMPRKNCKKAGEPYSYVGCGGMMVKRKVVEDIGMFDDQFNPAYFEDPDFNFRARKNGYKIGWNYLAKIDHLPHQTLGKNNNRMNIFAQSYNKFKAKWKGVQMLPLR